MDTNRMNKDCVLMITIDSCRYDTFERAQGKGKIPNLESIGEVYKAKSPSYFTYGSHSAFWMGFTPGVAEIKEKYINPKFTKIFKMKNMGFAGKNQGEIFELEGKNIIEGLKRLGYKTYGTGAVEWFNTRTDTGKELTKDFDEFYFAGNTWSLKKQLEWIKDKLSKHSQEEKIFLFINIGETHVPYWHEEADWQREPSPCSPFGGEHCSKRLSRERQLKCLEWIDEKIGELIKIFSDSTIIACSDHGDCWGENGLWEHGISHYYTTTVPLLIKVRGRGIQRKNKKERFNAKIKKVASMAKEGLKSGLNQVRRRRIIIDVSKRLN